MKIMVRSKLCHFCVLIIILGLSGCLGLSQDSTKKKSFSAESAVINPEPNKSSNKTDLQLTSRGDDNTPVKTQNSGSTGSYSFNSKGQKTFSEKDRVKQITLDLAQKFPAARKIKICHDKKSAEWWFTLYEESGDVIDIKQYVWKIDQDQPEPFLVIKRIARDSLQKDLNDTANRVCKILDQNPSGWGAVVAASFTGEEKPVKSETQIVKTETVPKSKQVTTTLPNKVAVEKRQKNNQPRTVHVQKKNMEEDDDAEEDAAHSTTPAKSEVKQSSKAETPPVPSKKSVATLVNSKKQPSSLSEETKFVKASSGADALIAAKSTDSPRIIKTMSDESIQVPKKTAKLNPSYDVPEPAPILPETKNRSKQKNNSASYFIFVYGTEMNHQELLKWFASNDFDDSLLLDASPAVMEDYDFVWNYYSPSRAGGAVNIEPRKHARIYGILLEVQDSALKAFDLKGGHPQYYSRGDSRMQVKRIDDDSPIHAWVYMANPNKAGKRDVWPTREYKQKIMEAAIFWQFPVDYIGKINDWPTAN
jgi:hypothetical protein